MDLLLNVTTEKVDQVIDNNLVNNSTNNTMQHLEEMVAYSRTENEGLQAEVQALAQK